MELWSEVLLGKVRTWLSSISRVNSVLSIKEKFMASHGGVFCVILSRIIKWSGGDVLHEEKICARRKFHLLIR